MTVPPEFWTTIQRCGPTGASQFNWRHQAGPAYSLLKPFLAFRPEPLVCTVLCHQCHRIRDVSNPYDNVYILEQPEDCDSCVPDRTIKREDLLRTSLNGQKFAAELAKALDFAAFLTEPFLHPSNLTTLGRMRSTGLSYPVVFMLYQHLSAVNLNALFPTFEPRVILHVEMEDALIGALQQRNFVPLHLPSLVTPLKGGTFSALNSLPDILRGVSLPVVAHEHTIKNLFDAVETIPRRTAMLTTTGPKRKQRRGGDIIEKHFTAHDAFSVVHFMDQTFTLAENPAAALMFIYHQMKEYGLSKVPTSSIFEEVYGSDKKSWPKNPRMQSIFQSGDAKRLWDVGFVGHDNKGNFHLPALYNT